ncbi:MAG: hypothetical protein V3S64_12745, partial [bacterium]
MAGPLSRGESLRRIFILPHPKATGALHPASFGRESSTLVSRTKPVAIDSAIYQPIALTGFFGY